MDNLYCAQLEKGASAVPLDDDLRRHIAALRLRDGEHVRVLNGRGLIALCRTSRGMKELDLMVESEQISAPPEPDVTVVLGVLDNRDRFEMAVEKLTELGVRRIVPLVCDRGQHLRSSLDRLQSKAVAAMTQSGNPFLPVIDAPTMMDALDLAGALVIVGDADGDQCHADAERVRTARRIVVVIGPEGGLSERELNVLRVGVSARFWRIGSLRLRAETAAVAVASVLRSML